MLHLDKLLHTQSGRYLMSLILGFGIATLFRETCKGKNCIIFKAPPVEDVDDNIFQFDDKCYKYNYKLVKCNSNKKTIHS